MAGSRRGRAGSPHQCAEPSPPLAEADSTPRSREVNTMERPSKSTCRASSSTSSPSSGPHVCADLLDNLLHEIIALFNSFHDFLAFIGTCRSWRAAVSTFPSVDAFSFRPFRFKPDGPIVHPRRGCIDPILLSNCKWQLSDPSKKNISLPCSVPQNTPDTMHYLGCSHGYLIFSYEEHCLLIDAYTGTKLEAPKLPPNNKLGYFCGIGTITAPLSSPNARLLLFSTTSMFEWKVGTNSWSEHRLALGEERIYQILFLKGDIFAIDIRMRLHTNFTPQFRMQKVAMRLEFVSANPWFVACGDMLLMIDILVKLVDGSYSSTFNVFCLDFSYTPAKWVKVERLENHALFVSLDQRNPSFSCMSPERWGGKSNNIYFTGLFEDPDEPWTAVEIGQPVHKQTVQCVYYSGVFPPDCSVLTSLWVFPSLIYGSG